MCSAANSISAQARSCQPVVAGVQAVDVAFTQINSGIYNEPIPAGQLLYLPLDDNVDKDGKLVFRDLVANARGTCVDTICPKMGGVGIVTPPVKLSYLFSDVVTLTAVAGVDSLFSGWSGDVVTTTNPLRLTIYGNTSITAYFKISVYRIYLPLVRR